MTFLRVFFVRLKKISIKKNVYIFEGYLILVPDKVRTAFDQ